jgi:hypothetical protein
MWFWLVADRQPQAPTITVQPESQTIFDGTEITFSVTAFGTEPLRFQWLKDGNPILGATAPSFRVAAVTQADAGVYTVVVSNDFGTANAEEALTVRSAIRPPGGRVNFNNRELSITIFNVDGTTRLSGSAFLAQLFGGPTAATLAPVGNARPFTTGNAAGFWRSESVKLPGAPGQRVVARVRVWDAQASTFEAASAAGLRRGESPDLMIEIGSEGGPPSPPARLEGFESFKLTQ